MRSSVAELKKAPQPLKHVWDHENVRCTAVCVAPNDVDWSLKDLYTPESGDSPFAREVADSLYEHGVRGTVFGPTVTDMNAHLTDADKLTTEILLPHGITLYRNPGLKADGLPLSADAGETFVMSGGGCPIIVAIGDGEVIAAHASRDSMIDRTRVMTGSQSRQHESVLHAIVREFKDWDISPSQVHVHVYFSVPAAAFTHDFSDAAYGAFNRALHRDLRKRGLGDDVMQKATGAFSIPALCAGLGRQLGLGKVEKSCMLPQHGRFGYTRNPIDSLKKARNLEFVTVERIH